MVSVSGWEDGTSGLYVYVNETEGRGVWCSGSTGLCLYFATRVWVFDTDTDPMFVYDAIDALTFFPPSGAQWHIHNTTRPVIECVDTGEGISWLFQEPFSVPPVTVTSFPCDVVWCGRSTGRVTHVGNQPVGRL
jgi:hypothetical protein